jgi:serine/threonine protein kinase
MSVSQGKIFSPGNIIQDKWVILEFIDKGAFGEVYRAHQLNLQRDVAIKVVSQEWLRSTLEDDDEIDIVLQRFRREVQAMARIRHPNVLQVFDNGSMEIEKNGNRCPVEFIVMEYIPGDTLRYTMSEEGFYPEQDLIKEWLEDYFLPVLEGVKAIHALDMTHRDLKPENVLMDGKTPKIADFGLARSTRLKPVTQSMDIKGTAHYMSPEHFFDFRKADHRADIYSLGKILYEAVDGKIDAKTLPLKTVSLADTETPFFQKLDEIIRKATAENKEERLDSVEKLRHNLAAALESLTKEPAVAEPEQPKQASFLNKPKWIWAGVALAVVSVAAMAFWHLFGKPEKSNTGMKSPPAVSVNPPAAAQPKILSRAPAAETTPAQTLLAEDGATLQFIAGGEVSLPESLVHGIAKVQKVDSFYIDEAPVTNHQFVHFLNQNLSTLTVAKNVVRQDDEIWLLIGEIFEGYTPIVFRNGKFDISQASYASFPVLRVTAFGAAAYVRFYGRRLPTSEEWDLAFGRNMKPEQNRQPDTGTADSVDMDKMHRMMTQGQVEKEELNPQEPLDRLSPVSNYPANEYGLRKMGKGFSEWSLRSMSSDSGKLSVDFDYVLMPAGVPRQAWEAFEQAGFRSAQNVERALTTTSKE